jgi:hypothetical protein
MGYFRQGHSNAHTAHKTIPDISPITRILSQQTVNYATALRMCEALNLDPVDLGV